jgi:predicted Zn-dependent protease
MNVHCPVCHSAYDDAEPRCPHCGPVPPRSWEDGPDSHRRPGLPRLEAGQRPLPDVRRPAQFPVLTVLIVVGLFVAASVSAIVSIIIRGPNFAGPMGGGGAQQGQDDWPADVRPVVPGKPEPVERLAGELRPVFDALRGPSIRGDGRASVEFFDLDRMLDEARLPLHVQPQKEQFRRSLREALIRYLNTRDPFVFGKYQFNAVRRLPGGEVVVFATHQSGGSTYWERWWLIKKDGSWKFYDHEFIRYPIRLSYWMRGDLETEDRLGSQPAWRVKAGNLSDAILAFNRNDLDAVERHLHQTDGPISLPEADGTREVLWARVKAARGNHADALPHLAAAKRLSPDMPIVLYMRGEALSNLRRWKEAVKPLEEFYVVMGQAPDSGGQLATAYRWLSRFKEAAAIYRRSLDVRPDQEQTLRDLLECLTDRDPREDIPARFVRLSNRPASFDSLCAEMAQQKRFVSVRQICDAMRKEAPNLPSLAYYDSLVFAHTYQADNAVARFREALKLQADLKIASVWRVRFQDAMVASRKPELAYEFAEDHRAAFRTIAAAIQSGNMAGMAELVRLHRLRHADDPLLPLYHGAALTWAGQYDEADEAFRKALAHPEAREVADTVRAARVTAKYNLGRAMEAYREVGPARDTFAQLSRLLENDAEELAALIKAHEARKEISSELLAARCLLLVRQGKYDDAVAAYQVANRAENDHARRLEIMRRFLSAMREAGRAVQGYNATPHSRQAFAQLSWKASAPWFPALLAAHKKRDSRDPAIPLAEAASLEAKKDWAGAVTILEREWAKADAAGRQRLQYRLLSALARVGRTARALELLPRGQSAYAISLPLIEQRRGPELLRLALAIQQRGDRPEDGLDREARAWLMMGRPKRALDALRRLAKLGPKSRWVVDAALDEFVTAGLHREAYEACGRSDDQFLAVGRSLLRRRKSAELLRFIAERQIAHPDSPQAHQLLFRLYKEHGDARQAEWHFRKLPPGVARAEYGAEEWLAVARGRALRYACAHPMSLHSLASHCEQRRDARQLRQLVALERRLHASSPQADLWEAKARLIKGDSAGALRLIETNRALLFRPSSRGQSGELLLRALVKAGRLDDARREAQAQRAQHRLAPLMELYIHASAGDAGKCLEVMAGANDPEELRYDCYRDPDLGPLLREPGFSAFREKYPERTE